MNLSLVDIFNTKEHNYEEIHDYFEKKLENYKEEPALVNKHLGTMSEIDLEGRVFILDRPLVIKNINLISIKNATFIAGPTFPKDKYLIKLIGSHGIQFRNLFFECSKLGNGIFMKDFFRIRVEDCYIVHQKSFGIYASPTGNNHELEIFKCHISEFLFGDGYARKKVSFGVIPKYDIDENRVSTGIFLGQADNIVADCNINLCKVGIFSGMRANRIHGNHITGGGSRGLEVFKGIELNNFQKSSALIVNNYIDNCCLWINCDSNETKNLRNYFHVTDNLFYRGYNHPVEGNYEFHHIVINPIEKDSLIANLHICDNNFYNQPENLNGIKPRIITPIHVNVSPKSNEEEAVSIDHDKLIGVSVKNNYFTNSFPTFVVPMGSEVVKKKVVTPENKIYKVDFDDEIPLGNISIAKTTIIKYLGEVPPTVTIKNIKKKTVVFHVTCNDEALIQIEVSSDSKYSNRFNYIIR